MREILMVCAFVMLWSGIQLWLAYSKGVVFDPYRGIVHREKNPAWFDFGVHGAWAFGLLALLVFVATVFLGTAGPFWWRGGAN